MEQQNNQIEKVPTFSKPDPTACLIKNINVEPTDISVGNYQSFLRGEDFDIFTSDLSLEVTDKLISSIPENHDLFVQEGFVNKTDKDAYQVYSDTDSVIGETIIKVNGKNIKIEDLWNNYGEIIDSNKEVKDTKSLNLFTDSVNNNFKIESKRITNVIRHKVSKKLYKVKLYDGDIIKEVIITEDHSIMCKRGDTLLEIKIGEIKDGDKLLYRANNTLVLKEVNRYEIEEVEHEETYVYDIEVEDNHNFFGNDILVHNSAYVLIKLPFSKTKDIQQTVIYCQAIAERLNKSYQKALELYFYRASNWHPEFNAMNFKSEVIAFKGFFGAKKFYGLGIIWKEGTFYDELDLKTTGGQIKKADITRVTKEMLSEIYVLLCLKLEATDQKLMYNTIFKKIKNKYTLKLREAIAKMDLSYFVIPKKWSFGEKKVVPAQIVGAKFYNRIIKDTISIGDSVSVLPIKFNFKTVIEWLEKNPCSNDNMMTNEEFSTKINYISLPVKISPDEFEFIQNRFKELSIIMNVDDIINFNIDMKLEPYKKLFSIETQRACYDNSDVYEEGTSELYDTNVSTNLLATIDEDDDVGGEE